jgi:hypothetical protein
MFRHSFAHTSAVAGAPKAALVLASAAAAAAVATADAALLDGVRS